MKRPDWFQRSFQFGNGPEMLPFFLERLDGTIVRLQRKVSGLPDRTLTFQPEGKWSIKQHIGHLAEVDGIALVRITQILGGISPMASAVVQPRRDYNAEPVIRILDLFISQRMENLKRYSSLTEAECRRSSLHPRLKVLMNPVDLAFFDAEHDDHHLLKIGDIIRAS